MKYFTRLLLLAALSLAAPALAQQYIGPTQTLPPGCNSTNFLRGDNSCQPVGGGTGTVTSVAETVPGFLALTGSPITTNGTLAITGATGQATHQVVGTGSTGTVALFALTAADLPGSITSNTSGNAGTATALAANPSDCSANQYATTIDAGGNLTCAQPSAGQVTGLAASATTDATNASNISTGTLAAARGGAGATTGALKGNGSGVVSQAACADLSNASASCSTDATNADNIGAGTLPGGRLPALTGDVNSSAGSAATTVRQLHNNVTSITNASSPYAVVSTDSFIYCDATAGSVVINLPAATGTGREIVVKKIDSTANACTPTRAGSDTIDGATSYSLTAQYAASKVLDAASAVWYRTHTNQLAGDVIGTSTANTVAKVNGNTPGGACTNQAVTSLNSSAVPTCTTLTSSYVDASIAQTGIDINTSNQVIATHLSAPLPATQGGSGQTTITLGDLLYGSASNVLSKLGGNTTAAKQFLSQTGTGTVSAAPAWGAIAATDIQGLTPVWTGNQEISDAEPRYILTETDQGADLKKFDLDLNGGVICLRTRTDADGAGQNAICATRGTTTALTNISLGYATSGTYSFPFTGLATFGGALTVGGTLTLGSYSWTTGGTLQASRLQLTTTTSATGTEWFLPSTNTLGCSAGGTQECSISTTAISFGDATNNPPFTLTGTGKFTTGGGVVQAIRVITASGGVTAATTDQHICVNKTTGAATTVNLFATPTTGTVLTVDDCKGDAATNNITVTPAAGNIDGSATFVINTNYGNWTGIYTGTIWKTEAAR